VELAAAQAAGEVSLEHVSVIARTLDKFPTGLTVAQFAAAEETLLPVARAARPREVAIAGARYRAYLDPDGVLADEREQDRQRELQPVPTDDRRWRVTGRLTGVCGAHLAAVLGPRSAPRPAADGEQDPRTHRQRLHDALEELAGIVVRRTELPKSGAPATVIITMTEQQYLARTGLVETSFGQPLSVPAALQLADEAILVGLVTAANGAVLQLGLTERIASRTTDGT
jgi:hypothetical protein